MTVQQKRPIVFLSFANDRDDRVRYLRNLPEEARKLRAVLETDKNLCEVIVRQNSTSNDILDLFQKPEYSNQITIFHFGGHANGYQLLMESATGQVSAADASGLAAFLGQQTGLKLVFLNGCSTSRQVEGLLEANVPAVIATSEAIDDKVAVEFANRFYKGLVGGDNIHAAYNEAQAAIQMEKGSNTRGLYWDDEAEAKQNKWPWGLYTRDDKAENWSLAETANVMKIAQLETESEKSESKVQIGGVNFNKISGGTINIDKITNNVTAGGDIVGGDKSN